MFVCTCTLITNSPGHVKMWSVLAEVVASVVPSPKFQK